MEVETMIDTTSDAISASTPESHALGSPPETLSSLADITAALRTINELAALTEDECEWLGRHCTERIAPDGSFLFEENELCHHLTLILSGDVYVHRRNSGTLALFFGRAGRITGKLPYSRMKAWGGDGCCSGSVWALDLHEDLFPAMIQAIPSMVQICVSLLLDRVREFTRADEQTTKLIALGKLAANLAHELNNPAAAAQRAANSLFTNIRDDDDAKYRLGYLCQSETELDRYREWINQACVTVTANANSPTLTKGDLSHSDREEEFLAWLEAHKVPDAWAVAPVLAEAAVTIESLNALEATVSPDVLPFAVSSFSGIIRSQRMASTVVGSTDRIFDIIAAIKDYSYMDQAPVQDVNLIHSLDTTLAMLQSRLNLVTVERDYDEGVPTIRAFGSELNEVWTALIENALDAMKDRGVLKLSIKHKGKLVFVEVLDDGPGFDISLKTRIFEPFFTTKPLGQGLGLGLDTVQRIVSKHFGSVSVESRPSATCFQVRLPLDRVKIY
jgi:signal transduction histidine kinase